MQLPLQVSFRHVAHDEAIEALVRERAARLDAFSNQIVSCRVVIELAARHHQHGNPYRVRIALTVPGKEIVAVHETSQHNEAGDIQVAIRDAFDSVRRQLEDYMSRKQGFVKVLEPGQHDRASAIVPEEDSGCRQ